MERNHVCIKPEMWSHLEDQIYLRPTEPNKIFRNDDLLYLITQFLDDEDLFFLFMVP